MRKLPIITRRADVDIRGVYGQSVLDLHEQMRRLLIQETGSELIGDFFAEPQINPVRGEIAWFSGAAGPIVAVAALPPESQQALWQQVDALREQIKAVAGRYIASGGQKAGTRADTFRAMLTVTAPMRCLFSVGGKPVLSEWGCTLVAGDSRSVDLWTIGADDTAAPVSGDQSHPGTGAVSVSPVPSSVAPELVHQLALPVPSEENPRDETRKKALGRNEVPEPVEPVPQRSARIVHTPRVATSPLQSLPSHGYWYGNSRIGSILKYLILLLLAVLLLGLLLRSRGEIPATADASAANEEKQLRAQILALREQAGQIAARCTPTGIAP